MKAILCTFLVWMISNQFVLGQGRFSLSLSVAPNYRYSSTHFSSTMSNVNWNPPVDIHIRTTGQSYSVGLMARYAISNQFSIATGIWRNYTSYQLPKITTIPDLSVLPSEQQIIGIATQKRNYQIPVLVNFQSSTKRLSPYFSVGGIIDFPSITIYENGNKGKTPNQNIRVFPSIGAGIVYKLRDRFSLIVQPTFTYFLPSSTFINYLNYQSGLQTQLMYHF